MSHTSVPFEVELCGRRVQLGFLGKGKLFDTDITGEDVVAEANKELIECTPVGQIDDLIRDKYYSRIFGVIQELGESDEYKIDSCIVAERVYEVLPEEIRRPTFDEFTNLITSYFFKNHPTKNIPLGLVCYAPSANSDALTDKLYSELKERSLEEYPLLLQNVGVRKVEQNPNSHEIQLYLKDNTTIVKVPALLMTAEECKRGWKAYTERAEAINQELIDELNSGRQTFPRDSLGIKVRGRCLEEGIYFPGQFNINPSKSLLATFGERRTPSVGERNNVHVSIGVGDLELTGVHGLSHYKSNIEELGCYDAFNVRSEMGILELKGRILLVKDL